MAEAAPKLSDDLNRFAAELDDAGLDQFEATSNGMAALGAAFARLFRILAIEARTLEEEKLLLEMRLTAADCRIEALTVPDYLATTRINLAIRDGVEDGSVIDLRAIFRDEQDFNHTRHSPNGEAGGGAA